MLVYRVEFDDFEMDPEMWLELVVEEDAVIVITAGSEELAVVTPYEQYEERIG